MKKYLVSIPYVCYVNVEVYAEHADEARDIAFNKAYLDSYVGNGGFGKLVGVRDVDMSVEPGDDVSYLDGFDVEVLEIK